MKNIFVENLVTGSDFDDFFILKSAVVRTGSNQKEYIDMQLSDRTGDVSAKKWDATEDEIDKLDSFGENPIIKVRASVGEWMNRKQLKIKKFRAAGKDDNFEINDFIKTAPEGGAEMYDFIMERISTIRDSELKNIAEAVMIRNKEKLMYYPAASSNHHAEMCGLLYHMKRMLVMGEKVILIFIESLSLIFWFCCENLFYQMALCRTRQALRFAMTRSMR